MFKKKPKCSVCSKDIKGNDVVFVKMRYPQNKGLTEIKAYLNNEGSFICEDCFNKNQTEKS